MTVAVHYRKPSSMACKFIPWFSKYACYYLCGHFFSESVSDLFSGVGMVCVWGGRGGVYES